MSTPANGQNPSDIPPDQTLRALLQMINGYQVTQMIYVAAKLGIADLLADRPKRSEELAEATQTHAPSLYRLLRALASLGIFAEDEQGCFGLTPLAHPLRNRVPDSLRAWALFVGDAQQWRPWGELIYSVTTGETAFQHVYGMGNWDYRAQNPEANAIFNDAMTTRTIPQTAAVLAAYNFSGIHTLVDVGGGQGILIAAILKANPGMQGILFDVPHVVAGAPTLLEKAGVADRCEVVGGDFFTSVPKGGDAYLLKSVIHNWDDERSVAILRNCHSAMAPAGKLLVVDAVIPPGNSSHPGKLLDIMMLVGNAGGRERTEGEFRALLAAAGFTLTQVYPTQGVNSIVEGVPV